jgi:rhomboid protease GluP
MVEPTNSVPVADSVRIACPGCGFGKDVPRQRVPAAGTMATCPKCACRFPLTMQPVAVQVPVPQVAPQAVAEQTPTPRPVLPDQSKPVPSFAVKVKFQGFSRRDNRFKGEGNIKVQGEYFEITGRLRRSFAFRRKTERYPLTALRNVSRNGDVVSFAMPLEKGHWQAYLVCAHESSATALVNRLPVIVDSNLFTFGEAQQELKTRMEQLPQAAPAAWALLALNILVYLAVAWSGANWLEFKPDYLADVGGNFSPYTTDGQWWRLVSAMFLHSGLMHLVFNMYALYSFGLLAERLYGTKAFLGIYLLAGVVGSCGTLLFSSNAVGVGASGAIFGIMGALVAFLATDKDFLSDGARKRLLTNFAIFAAYMLSQGFGKAGIDNAAHVGGILTGLTLGWFTGSPLKFRQEGGDWLSGRVAAGIALVLLVAGVAVAAAPKPGADFRIHVAMIELTKELGAKESALSEEMKRIAAKGTSTTPADVEQMVRQLKTTHDDFADRLAVLQPTSPELQARRQVLLDYVALKQKGSLLLAEGIEKTDARLVEEGKQKVEEGNNLAKELAKPVKWG